MSKPFDYSKWDNIELSDDEDDVHPNIDRESWFRMKHRSRVEREEREDKEKARIHAEMEKANKRIQLLEHDLAKIAKAKKQDDDDDDDDDDEDLDDTEGLKAELSELRKANADRQAKLDEYERNKKWNVDNLCHVAEERTIISTSAGSRDFHTASGFAKSDLEKPSKTKTTTTTNATTNATATTAAESQTATTTKTATTATTGSSKSESSTTKSETKKSAGASQSTTATTAVAGPDVIPAVTPKEVEAFETYHEFTERYASLVEEFMHLESMEASHEFLLQHGSVLLQENASSYLLLASLEDEMNGLHEKMKLTARQSQIISNIAELAKSLNAHPGNVVTPFFQRLGIPEFRTGFEAGVHDFVRKIEVRAVRKRAEMDAQRQEEEDKLLLERAGTGAPVNLEDVPREERLGPGGLDPVEVMKTLPVSMQRAFETRNVEDLKSALLEMNPSDAERYMKDCVDSGLWVSNE